MAQRFNGEVILRMNGQDHVMRLTLGALAELEEALATTTLLDLIERIESARFTARDIVAILVAGLRGGGWQGGADDLAQAQIDGGPMAAATAAAQLIQSAFTLPMQADE